MWSRADCMKGSINISTDNVILIIYVDNILITRNDNARIACIKVSYKHISLFKN